MIELLTKWLFYQCGLLQGSLYAKLLTGPPDAGPFDRVLFWPEKRKGHDALDRVAQTALRSKKAVIEIRKNAMEETGEPLDCMACPLFVDGRLIGVVAIEMTARSKSMQQSAVRQVRAGAKLLDTIIRMNASAVKEKEALANLVEMVSVGLEQDQFREAATVAANELAERFSCRRVSFGFLGGNRLRVEAMSQCVGFDGKSGLVRAIQDAMNEALDQGATVVYPIMSNDALTATRFHAQLADEQQGASVCTVPLISGDNPVGVLLLERALEDPFSSGAVKQLERIGLLLGPVLETRRLNEQPLAYRVADTMKGWFSKLFGPRYAPLKTAVALIAVFTIWLSMANGMFRISADSLIEANIQRAVVSPQKGYIAAAHARAGDMVQEGDLLATLDDKDLLLEQRKWQSQLAQLVKEYRKALAGSNRTEVAILNAKRSQAEAQLELVEKQVARTSLVAPLSGLVIKGDLSQALGSPVERGEVLYEVAPTDEYRVVLKVDHRDIGLVAPAQKGRLKLSGIPDRSFHIQIDRMTPVSVTEGGRNFFRVEATMEAPLELIRPGMEGIAKIDISSRKLVWIWTRRLVEWFRLVIWSRLP